MFQWIQRVHAFYADKKAQIDLQVEQTKKSQEMYQTRLSPSLTDEQKARWFIGKLEDALQGGRTTKTTTDIYDLQSYLNDLCCDMADWHTVFGGQPHFTRDTLGRAYNLIKQASREFQQTDVGRAATRFKRDFQREVLPYLPPATA